MKVTIEEINGVKHTLITVDDAEAWELEEAYKITDWRGVYTYIQGKYAHPLPATAYVIAYALPPLPRNPKQKDLPLLYAYAAQGINVTATYYDGFMLQEASSLYILRLIHGARPLTITHAMNNGERVKIAIREDV